MWETQPCPPTAHGLVPRTRESTTSHGKREWSDVVKRTIVTRADGPGPGLMSHKGPRDREAGGSGSEKEMRSPRDRERKGRCHRSPGPPGGASPALRSDFGPPEP